MSSLLLDEDEIDLMDKHKTLSVKLHMDVKAQSSETAGSVPELIARYAPTASSTVTPLD